jgi:hypothetical protein
MALPLLAALAVWVSVGEASPAFSIELDAPNEVPRVVPTPHLTHRLRELGCLPHDEALWSQLDGAVCLHKWLVYEEPRAALHPALQPRFDDSSGVGLAWNASVPAGLVQLLLRMDLELATLAGSATEHPLLANWTAETDATPRQRRLSALAVEVFADAFCMDVSLLQPLRLLHLASMQWGGVLSRFPAALAVVAPDSEVGQFWSALAPLHRPWLSEASTSLGKLLAQHIPCPLSASARPAATAWAWAMVESRAFDLQLEQPSDANEQGRRRRGRWRHENALVPLLDLFNAPRDHWGPSIGGEATALVAESFQVVADPSEIRVSASKWTGPATGEHRDPGFVPAWLNYAGTRRQERQCVQEWWSHYGFVPDGNESSIGCAAVRLTMRYTFSAQDDASDRDPARVSPSPRTAMLRLKRILPPLVSMGKPGHYQRSPMADMVDVTSILRSGGGPVTPEGIYHVAMMLAMTDEEVTANGGPLQASERVTSGALPELRSRVSLAVRQLVESTLEGAIAQLRGMRTPQAQRAARWVLQRVGTGPTEALVGVDEALWGSSEALEPEFAAVGLAHAQALLVLQRAVRELNQPG